MVRAKFKVTEIKRIHAGKDAEGKPVEQQVVMLNATNDKEGDNQDWTKWTPSGQLSMHITTQGAIDKFELGRCYWLDFSPVEA